MTLGDDDEDLEAGGVAGVGEVVGEVRFPGPGEEGADDGGDGADGGECAGGGRGSGIGGWGPVGSGLLAGSVVALVVMVVTPCPRRVRPVDLVVVGAVRG